MLNVPGTNQTDIHSLAFTPTGVVPGDALVVAKPNPRWTPGAQSVPRPEYWGTPGRSACSEMTAAVFVPYAPTPGLLRPPAIGNSWLARWMRTIPIPESMVRVSSLPSVVDTASLGIDYSAWACGEPTAAYLTHKLRKFCGECYDGWNTDSRTPDWQHPGYGTNTACVSSQTGIRLSSTDPVEVKLPLALAVVQRGLDLIGAYSDGRYQPPENGHCAGRKALIVMTGHLLGVPELCDPTSIIGPKFQEDLSYRARQWWAGGWDAGWASNATVASRDGSWFSVPPSQWGDVTSSGHSSWAWAVNSYMGQTVGAQVGTALTMRLWGRVREMGIYFDKFIAQWMQGPTPEVKNALTAAGVNVPWGTDFNAELGNGFSAAAYRKYAN